MENIKLEKLKMLDDDAALSRLETEEAKTEKQERIVENVKSYLKGFFERSEFPEWIRKIEERSLEAQLFIFGLSPKSDYLKLARFLAHDEQITAEEYRLVDGWAEKQQEKFLSDLDKEDKRAGRNDVVRGVILDLATEVDKDDCVESLRFAKDRLEMSDEHRERLKQWILERESSRRAEAMKELSPAYLAERDAPIKFHKMSNFDRKNAREERQYDVITKNTELAQLKQIVQDYE